MLIISRKKDQKIMVADDIEITVLEVGKNRVRFGISAPKHIAIQTRQPIAEVIDGEPLTAESPVEQVNPREVLVAMAVAGSRH